MRNDQNALNMPSSNLVEGSPSSWFLLAGYKDILCAVAKIIVVFMDLLYIKADNGQVLAQLVVRKDCTLLSNAERKQVFHSSIYPTIITLEGN